MGEIIVGASFELVSHENLSNGVSLFPVEMEKEIIQVFFQPAHEVAGLKVGVFDHL